MNGKFLTVFIFSAGLSGCPGLPPAGTQLQNPSSAASGAQPQKALLPVWQQTEYIFYNKTASRVKITFVQEGKVRKKDGTIIERSGGGTRGEDGVFREFIINAAGETEYVTREYEETSAELQPGQCVFTPSYYVLDFETGGKALCETYRSGSPDPERPCGAEVNKTRDAKGWRNTESRGEGPFSYVEFYNIVNKSRLFEGAAEPQELNDSFTHSCKKLLPKGYKPWSERTEEFDRRGGGLRTL